jgi:hypothetical protein
MNAREVLEDKLSRRHPSDVATWLNDYREEIRIETSRENVARIRAAKEKRDEDFYPYFPESYGAETDGWESAIDSINPDKE